jgi:hypothetical protein
MFEAKAADGSTASPDDRDLLAVLGALEASLGATLLERAGATAFLDTAARIAGRTLGRPGAARAPLIVAP